MKELFIFLLLFLLSIPFGFSVLIPIASIIGIYLIFRSGDFRFLSIPISSILAIISPIFGIVTIFFLLYFDEDDEVFIRISSFIASLLVVFIIFPILFLFISSPPNFVNMSLINSIITSMVSATLSTMIGIALGLPLGYILARRNFAGKEFVEGIIDLPIVIPHTVSGIILLLVFGTTGIIGSPLNEIGIKFYYALPGIVTAMLFVSVPFLINQIREGIDKIDERYELVAMNLGASRAYAFFSVTLPLIRRNLLVGSINAWARAMSEFGAVIVIAFYPMVAPTYIYSLYENYGLKASLPATSFLLLITLGIFIALRVIVGRMKNA